MNGEQAMKADDTDTAERSQSALARALGISKAAVSKCKARGMPVDSVAAATAWRREHLNPARSKRTLAVTFETQLRAVEALWPIAAAALAGDRFDLVRPQLQQALRAVPPQARHLVLVDVDVMEALCASFAAVLRGAGAEPAMGNASLTPSDAEVMGRVWYCVAAGERFPAAWLLEA